MKGKWGSDIGLSARMLLTMILLGIVYVAFIGIILLYVRNIAAIAVFVALFLGAQYYFSDRVVLAASGAHIVSEDEAPELHSAIERLCAMADLPKPHSERLCDGP
jgi:heat shock protein HtpX